MKALSLLGLAAVLVATPAAAKDALELTRQCMIEYGAKRQPDGGVFLSGPQEKAEAIRAKCRKQSSYKL
ncbi:hypothetical protein [Tardiphaga sp.]|uniref:hypothetical protein n=1 Tax=Tardiphaga sp. TaxID=1926292 RepID=UPI0025F276D4|nr:hypothetical protein [Tardiphaga sp.]